MLHKYRKTALIEAEQVLTRAEAEYYQLALSWDPASLDCGERWVIDQDIFERTYERVD